MKRRFLGILLSFAMMLTMMSALSLTALAATGGNIPGTSLTWELSDTGTLTIGGTGDMPDYESDPPWKPYKDQIKSIVIMDGVTRIGKSAFSASMRYCTENLTQVTIPSSVTSIGGYVFNQCNGITNVSLGSSVIGEGMFQGCSGLTQITIPSNVTSIASSAFSGCSGLTQITIPSNVTSIASEAFYRCSGLTQITIPSNVTSIGTAAFYDCTNLEKVTFTPAEEGKTLEIGGASFSDNAKVAYGTGNTRLYDGDTEIQANASLSSYNNKILTWKPAAPTPTPTPTPTPAPAPAPAPANASITVNSKTVSAGTLAAAYAKAGVNPDNVATVVLGKKVKKIKKGSFQNLRNADTLVVKSKKLTKARVKGSLKGSSITKVKVKVGKKKTNKYYVKRYKKIFTKKNCGKKVSVSR